MNQPQTRLSRPTDIAVLKTLDAKAYQYPLSMKTWEELVKGQGSKERAKVVVLEEGRSVVGFVVWRSDTENPETVELFRLGVVPDRRRQGYGTRLVDVVTTHSRRDMADKIRCVVPEIHCIPGDPDDVSAFLIGNFFIPTGDIVRDYKVMYGDEVDGFVFERTV